MAACPEAGISRTRGCDADAKQSGVGTALSDISIRVVDLLEQGECATIEFKSSMRWDYRQERVNTDLTKVVARTLSAFLNSKGGTLLIGVDDDAKVLGIEHDLTTLSKASTDKYELTLRNAISTHLGASVDPHVGVKFEAVDDKLVALATCSEHPEPVYFADGNRVEMLVRAGNLTRSLDIRSAVQYVRGHWAANSVLSDQQLRSVIEDALTARDVRENVTTGNRPTQVPTWLSLSTRRVLDLYLNSLARSHGWKRLHIVSPWISEFSGPLASLSFDQFLRRLESDKATAYIVTRPPVDDWHARAIERLAETGRASISLLPELHMKLFTAQTAQSSFAMMGSANFTGKSLSNRELGVLVSSVGDGRTIVRDLDYEAAEIYRHPQRKLHCKAKL